MTTAAVERPIRYDAFRVTGFVEPGQHGSVTVDTVIPADTQERAALLALTGNGTARVGETYTRLLTGGRLQMSDTRDEHRDHFEAIYQARGRVLLHGLGLGCVLKAILAKPEVDRVDVVEVNEDVIAYVGPYYAADSRVNLIHGDAFEVKWPRGSRWDVVWHDIWPDKCEDDLAEHAKLLRSFGRRAGWQGAWVHGELLYYRRRNAGAWWS